MDLDPEGLFRDNSDSDDELALDRVSTKDLVVYLVDAAQEMFVTAPPHVNSQDEKKELGSPFHAVIRSISEALKAQIIGSPNDQVAICFFNTIEKKNLQDSSSVYVFNVAERESLDRPTARLIKEFSSIEDTFLNDIGSRNGIISGSRENSLYNALWVAQALLRKGNAKNVSKRILIFTNEDDPFRNITGAMKTDMVRTTIQRAKDAKDLGISIELLPLNKANEEFNVSLFYSDLIGLEDDEISLFLPSAGERLEDMTDQLRKRIFKKRKIKTLLFSIANDINIEVNTYALIRPTLPGSIMWLDSVTNLPLRTERSFICSDTGALVQEQPKRFHPYRSELVTFTVDELSKIKNISNSHLRLLGFKPLECLKEYHNLRPSTFIFPTDEDIFGSTRIFMALHKSMLRLKRFAVAFGGGSTHSQLVALVAQGEKVNSNGQVDPPGMHMIYLPYSDDIRHAEEHHITVDNTFPHATDDQIKKASALLRRIDLKDFSVHQFSNPALQRHYGMLQALALGEDEIPDMKDETLPDEEGMARPGIIRAMEEFKIAVYGENHDQEEADMARKGSDTDASRKRKAMSETATRESASYDWASLADNGKLKDLTVVELKYYLTAHNLPVGGKKEALISRILTHLGK